MGDAKALSLIYVDRAFKNRPDVAIPSPDFAPYVVQSLRVLRGAAAAGLNTSEDANVRRAICFYFVASCLGRLKSRAKAFSKVYQLEELLGWANQKDLSIKAEEFSIDNSLVELGFKQTELQSIKDTGRERIFELNTLTAPACWKVLISLFKTLMNLIGNPADVSGIVQVSVAIHHLLKQLPTQFWKLPSLNKHLADCWERRSRTSCQTAPPPHTKMSRDFHPSTPIGTEEFAREDEQAIQDEAEDINNLPATRPLSDALPFCRSFYQAANAITAWTTAPMALLRSRISTASPPIDVTIVGLPQLPISTTTVQELVGCWDQSGMWTTAQRDTISKALASIDPSTTPPLGACHAEAGLIASALVQRPRSKTGVQGGRDDIGQEEPGRDKGRDGGGEGRGGSIQNEPEELKNIFEIVFDKGPSELKLAIGLKNGTMSHWICRANMAASLGSPGVAPSGRATRPREATPGGYYQARHHPFAREQGIIA
ncbi:hypothetical protein GGX14DRAFT_554290 [Mycena pura]|uniref:Uncharacterized protein n=1 Tax=Mycena pura TaxID=153505 RepID=A0AAD6YS55_9AGAR|nr:hypothetical protein GGX14DRAFT_554290 [Mycena pura]